MTNLDKYLSEIKSREEAATKGPWVCDWTFCDPIRVRSAGDNAVATMHGNKNGDNAVTDGTFVAHARTDIPRLRTMVEVAYRRWGKLSCECDSYHGYTCERCKALAELERLAAGGEG